MLQIIRPVWAYRGFIIGSVHREFQLRYRNSLLGAAWTILQPLAMIVVYTVIFSQVMRARLPGVESASAYSIYLCAGNLTWAFFAEITARAQNTFIENANLLKKLSFPRVCLPTIVVLTAAVNFTIVFGLFAVYLLMTSQFPGWPAIGLIPLLAVETAFSIGLGMTLGVLNVFFRDIGQLFSVLLQFWFWFTPIVYPMSILPPGIRDLMKYNPMADLVQAYQAILVTGTWPEWQSLWLLSLLAGLFCVLGFRLYRRYAGEIVDDL